MSSNPHNLEAPHREARCHNPSAYHRQDRPNQTSVIRYENNQRGPCLTERTQDTRTSNDAYHPAYYSTQDNSYLKQEPEDLKQEKQTEYEYPQIRRNTSIIQYNHSKSPYYEKLSDEAVPVNWTHSESAR